MGLARHARMPVLVVGDIDRGGVLAAMYGTLGLLDEDDQALVRGWVVNKFRGDLSLLEPGLRTLTQRTGRPVLGVIPWLDGVWLDSEDALAVAGWRSRTVRRGESATLRVAVVRFPRVSNATDVDALALEPGVAVTVTADPDVVASSDIAVLPGSRSTAMDLAWLRRTGLADVIVGHAAAGRPVLGICGGYQMLAGTIDDTVVPAGVESGTGVVPGLGLLPTSVRFGADKVLGRPTGTWRGQHVLAYEIHHGVATLADTAAPADLEKFLDGWRVGAVWGTTWHGAFENDGFRRAWLAAAAAQAGVAWVPSSGPGFATVRERMVDTLADAVEEHVDTGAVWRLVEQSTAHGVAV
jgi:adenosylcobyric acid synthase